jgi:hypothetical protein
VLLTGLTDTETFTTIFLFFLSIRRALGVWSLGVSWRGCARLVCGWVPALCAYTRQTGCCCFAIAPPAFTVHRAPCAPCHHSLPRTGNMQQLQQVHKSQVRPAAAGGGSSVSQLPGRAWSWCVSVFTSAAGIAQLTATAA